MDAKIIIFAIITIGSIVLFVLDLNSSSKQDKINEERIEFEEKQDEFNLETLKKISQLQKQINLSKSNDSLFDIGGEKWTYEEIQNYLKKQTVKSNSVLNRAIAFYELGQLKKSKKLFLEALKIYPKNHDKKALINSYLGELYLRLPEKLPDAKNYSFRAYKFYKSNEEISNEEYEWWFGNVTNNLGRILKKEGNYKKALKYYNESVNIRKKLAKNNSPKYLTDLAGVYNNMAVMFREYPKLGDSETLYLKALEIKKEVIKNNKHYLPEYALTLNNLGNLYHEDQDNFKKSEAYFKEAIDVYQLIVDNGKSKYLIDLANSQAGYALALESQFVKTYNMKYFRASEYWFMISLDNFYKIENGEIYNNFLSNFFHNIGRLYGVSGVNEKSEEYYIKALKIREKLAISGVPNDEIRMADTQLNLAILYTYSMPNKDLALNYANQSLVNYRKNIDFKDSKKWIKKSLSIIDFWKDRN